MSPETLTFEEASKLLSLPRVVATTPKAGSRSSPRTVGTVRTWSVGKDTRSLADEDHISSSIDLEGALQLLAEPKVRGRRAAAGPLRELGEDPLTKRNIVVRNGRSDSTCQTRGERDATHRRPARDNNHGPRL